MKYYLLAVFLLFSFSGVNAMEIIVNEDGIPKLDQFSEEGFVDCVFKIEDLEETEHHYNFHLSAIHKGKILGLNVKLWKKIRGGFDSNMELIREHVYREGVVFFRSGPESDNLISSLAQLYGQGSKASKMVNTESYTAIALHQNDIDLKSENVKIKIFGNDKETDDENDYYESFFNVDLKNGFVYWNEKDTDNRAPLIRALSNN